MSEARCKIGSSALYCSFLISKSLCELQEQAEQEEAQELRPTKRQSLKRKRFAVKFAALPEEMSREGGQLTITESLDSDQMEALKTLKGLVAGKSALFSYTAR